MERKTKTTDIGRGIDYATVADRSTEFHQDNAEQCSVETSCVFEGDYVVFSATVTTKKGRFSGHSMGQVSQQKAFEKLETVSVGRALAFAGYLASGAIACAEEMADIVTESQFNSLKVKYANTHAGELAGKDRVQKQHAFGAWCMGIVGEQADYTDHQNWDREWYRACWRELTPDADVPFEE